MGWLWSSLDAREARRNESHDEFRENGVQGNDKRKADNHNFEPSSVFSPLKATSTSSSDADSSLSSILSLSTVTLIIPTILATAVTTAVSLRFYKLYLRRIPNAAHVRPEMLRKRSIFGKVTSVGDGDNFRLFHTPGGRLAGWEWARGTKGWAGGGGSPSGKGERGGGLVGQTVCRNTPLFLIEGLILIIAQIHIRIAGVDAPELAHFGRPAQPHGQEALTWLTAYILGRRVRAYVHRRDQYDRIVATVFVRRWRGDSLFSLPWPRRRDVGLEMLRKGLATVYEAKKGAEFGGLEEEYRRMEAWAKRKGVGLWATNGGRMRGVISGRVEEEVNVGPVGRWLAKILGRSWRWVMSQTEVLPPAEKFESPREYKNRMLELERAREKENIKKKSKFSK